MSISSGVDFMKTIFFRGIFAACTTPPSLNYAEALLKIGKIKILPEFYLQIGNLKEHIKSGKHIPIDFGLEYNKEIQ